MKIDINAKLRTLLIDLLPIGKHMKRGDIPIYTPPGLGGGVTVPAPKLDPDEIVLLPFNKDYDFTNLFIEDSQLLIEKDAEIIGIPIKDNIQELEYDNPFDTQQVFVIDINSEIIEGWKMSMSRTLTSSNKVGGKLNFKLAYKGVEVGGENSFERVVTDSITETTNIDKTTRQFKKQMFTINIPAKIKAKIFANVQNYEAKRDYSGYIIIDGEIELTSINPLIKEKLKISDFLDIDKRKIEVSGSYSDITWDKLKVDIDILEKY